MFNFDRYAPAKYAPPPASRPQAALSAVQSLEALEVIGKLVRNIATLPAEAKFRQVKLANTKVTTPPQIAFAALTRGWLLCKSALPVLETLLLSCLLVWLSLFWVLLLFKKRQKVLHAPRLYSKPGARWTQAWYIALHAPNALSR